MTHQIHVPKKVIKPEDFTVEDIRSLGKDDFLAWALSSGVKVDSNTLEFDNHRYLIPIYADHSTHIVWQKAAQLGATIYMLLRVLWWLEHHQGRKAGLYFPTSEGVQNLSSDRLVPIINSAPSIAKIYNADSKQNLRRIGESSFYLYHLGGVASKDSVPLDFVAFDEVRLSNPKDIDQALHRISHSPYKYKVFMSTAGLPGLDIAQRYERGRQLVWRSSCGCTEGCDLASSFPQCMITDDPRRPNDVYLRCPDCGWEIKDPQNGRYVPENPGADFNSYRVSQLVSKFRTPKEIWQEYLDTTNMEEFYNAALGLPYLDEANQGVSLSHLKTCINPSIRWMKDESKESRKETRTAMGIDQGGAYLMAVILDINPDGTKKRVRHVEIVEQNNPRYYDEDGKQQSPFVRAHELMEEFNVGLCVVDMMPNFNDALKFAQAFPGRVYLGHYQRDGKDVVRWADRVKANMTIAKAGPMLKFKYVAQLGRYPAISFALGEWAENNVEIPPLDGLVQMCRSEIEKGRLMAESPGERLLNHLARAIKRWKETDAETGSGRWEWRYAGGDPHLLHAFSYANVALERLRRKTKVSFM